MDLLKYSETVLEVCLAKKSKREIHDILRQIYVHPTRILICPCWPPSPWVRHTLAFLGARYSNEPSHQPDGPWPNRELLASEEK